MEIWIIILLYCAGLVMVVMEAMMPGITIGIIGTIALIVSIFLGFGKSTAFGVAQIVIALVFVPAVIVYTIRRLTLKSALDTKNGAISFANNYTKLIGKRGKSLTPLHPAGTILVDGKKVDVLTAGEMIDKDKVVSIIKIEGNKIIVKEEED